MTMSNLNTNKLLPTKTIPWGNFSNSATGTYTDGNGQSWKYIQFTSGSNTLTVTDSGYFDCLVVGGGGGAATTPMTGTPGWVVPGIQYLSSGSVTAVVGAGGASGAPGGDSSLGTIVAGGGDRFISGTVTTVSSSITGSAVDYGGSSTGNGTPANTGAGGASSSGAWAGCSGVVIVRVRTN